MLKHYIDILAIQEKQIKQSRKDKRKHHTWYLSGETEIKTDEAKPTNPNHTWAGVGIVI